jgi:soluble lytic murein transglycosylase-like protein
MRSNSSTPPPDQTAALSQGGCLSGFLLPPLTVILVGLMLACLWLGPWSASVPVALAAEPNPDEASFMQDGTGQSSEPLSPVFQADVQYWSDDIQTWASAAGLDPNLVATVMQIESCGDPRALSGAGAMGLFQVMPYHFATGDNPYDQDTNALRGLAYLKRSLEAADGDPRLALAGYNGGIGIIGRPESSWPAETQRYAYWGNGIYEEASSGANESIRLQEWLGAGGASLCHQAAARLGINP